MKLLWLISQDENDNADTYDSAVVCASSEDAARQIHPSGDPNGWEDRYTIATWAQTPEAVAVELIGTATDGVPEGVVLASFIGG